MDQNEYKNTLMNKSYLLLFLKYDNLKIKILNQQSTKPTKMFASSQYKNQMKSNSRINKQQQVQVVIRLKPESPQNKYQRCAYLASEDSNALVVEVPNKKEYFVFDAIANEDTSQFQLYQNIGSQAVLQSLEGYNCSIFAYGQTGSGKTYSILGILPDIIENIYAQTRGILPRLLEDLFRNIKSTTDKCTIKCSYMEIYNEQIFDLLTESFQFLQIRQGPQKGVYVEGINTFTINTYQQAINFLLQGQKNRKTAQTGMNKQSSRSHTIFTVNIESSIMEQDTIKVRKSKINIIDLAGSQRVKHTNVEGQRLRQGCNINKSLHVLGNVINALVQSSKKKKHIPFRDSKLTYYLKDSLGGNSITKLLANIQCNSKYLGDTLSTLMFAKRAKILKMKVQINENTTQNYETLRKQIKKLREQLAQAKYINQTRLSDRFQTQNQTQLNIQKFDTSNFEYSSTDKPIQVFEENELHYKALIQIYEEHMRECSALNNENYNSINSTFTKKKTSNILSHSEWKKLQKKNMALMSLMKRVPAFTKIYRQNQLLKQERNHERKIQKGQKQLSFTEQQLPEHSRTLSLQYDSTQLQILHNSYTANQHQQEQIYTAVQKTIRQYQQIITQMKIKFTQCLNDLDISYIQLEKQIEQKDRKIREISKRQYQLPNNIEQLIDQNQYLKLNILELQSEINNLEKELEQNRIKQRQQGRRYSLFQQPLSNMKITPPDNNWLPSTLNTKDLQPTNHLNSNIKTQPIEKLIQHSAQLQICNNIITSLQNFKKQALKQAEQYEMERQQMLNCIQSLQNECKRLMTVNEFILLKNQDLKTQNKHILQQIHKQFPQFNLQSIQQPQQPKPTQQLWKRFNQLVAEQQNLEQYKQTNQLEIQSLYNKLKQMEKIRQQLNLFILKEKATEKEFGKSINQILQEYAQMLLNHSNPQSISLNSRHSAITSQKALLSPRNSKVLGQFSASNLKSTKDFRQKFQTEYKKESVRGNSRTSSKASQEKRLYGVQSPKK